MSEFKKDLSEEELEDIQGGLRAARGSMTSQEPIAVDPTPAGGDDDSRRTDHVTDEDLEDLTGGLRTARANMTPSRAIEVDPLPGDGDDGPGQIDRASDPTPL